MFIAEFVDPVDAVDAGADAEESFGGSELRVAIFEGVILGCLSPSSQGPVVADDVDTADAVDGLLLLRLWMLYFKVPGVTDPCCSIWLAQS